MEPRQINFPHQSRYPGAEFNCLYFSYCPRESYQNPQICQTIAKIHGCSLQSNREGTIYRTKTHILTELGDINILPTYNLNPYNLVSLVWKGFLQAEGREMWKPSQPKTLWPTICLAYKF